MIPPGPLAEIWRGDILESQHLGHIAVCDASGDIVFELGDPDKTILPRSSCKMVQAIPLIESGAADAFGLTDRQIALACASHEALKIHTDAVQSWLKALGLGDDDLRCGPQWPEDPAAARAMAVDGQTPCRYHNTCSGKHTGFLTLSQHLGGGPEYIDIGHPVQLAMRTAIEDLTQSTSPGHVVDGCSAPNFATTMRGLARAMAAFSSPSGNHARSKAMRRIIHAVQTNPEMIAGDGFDCTEIMRAATGGTVVKFGAEGVYVATLPAQRLGIAIKCEDGAKRGALIAVLAMLVRFGAIPPDHPTVTGRMRAPILSKSGIHAGHMQPAPGLVP